MGSPFSPVQVNDASLQRVLDEDTRRTTEQGRRDIAQWERRMGNLFDGKTGEVIEETRMAQRGFGETRRLLEVSPFRHTPWLTPELCEQEMALQGTKGS